jgi:hypothetical protein
MGMLKIDFQVVRLRKEGGFGTAFLIGIVPSMFRFKVNGDRVRS